MTLPIAQGSTRLDGKRLYYVSAAASLALMTGDYSRCYRLLKEWRETGDAESEGTFTWFLTLVGDYEDARSAGLRALNKSALARNGYRHVAIDMLHLANSAQHLGSTREALDWLSRALRITRSLRGSDLDSFALQIAADVALQKGLPGIATLLLDQAITSVGETVWDTNAASILLLYGRALERSGDSATADHVYEVAAQRGAREHGSALITADSVRADLAARRGDIPLALQLSEEAFRTVLDGRSRIGQENYKLSFVANSQSVGEQYLRLHAEASVPAPTLLDSIEAWRLQVFKDIYLGGLSSEAPPQRIADALQAALRRDEAYVAYTIGEQWSEAILVSPSAVSAVRLPIDRAGIFRDLAALRHWLSPSMADAVTFIRVDRVPPELEAALHDLHDKLISPLGLGSEVRFLAISPDESLAGLPWGALLDPETTVDAVKRRRGFQALRPLYQRLATAIIPSAQILLRSMPVSTDSTASSGGVGLVGAFEGLSASQKAVTSLPGRGSVNQGLPELGHGVEELSAIAKTFQTQPLTVLLDSTSLRKETGFSQPQLASSQAVLGLLPRSSIVHIVGHAVFNSQAPMESEILLDRESRSSITAEDLLKLDLSNTRLVVLSARETGQGQMATGGETFGFLRGLMGANARSAVLSLWPVDDTATAELASRFY